MTLNEFEKFHDEAVEFLERNYSGIVWPAAEWNRIQLEERIISIERCLERIERLLILMQSIKERD